METGLRFTRLVVIGRSKRVQYANKFTQLWSCQCDCGNIIDAASGNLYRGSTKSCGCLKKETAGRHRKTHGLSKTAEYQIWAGMKKRCHNKNSTMYYLYGARGITVCEEWRNSFQNFINDMGHRPSPEHSIDRINNGGNYSKDNCRWATKLEQGHNTSIARHVSWNGKTYTTRALATALGADYFRTYHFVIRKGMDPSEFAKMCLIAS